MADFFESDDVNSLDVDAPAGPLAQSSDSHMPRAVIQPFNGAEAWPSSAQASHALIGKPNGSAATNGFTSYSAPSYSHQPATLDKENARPMPAFVPYVPPIAGSSSAASLSFANTSPNKAAEAAAAAAANMSREHNVHPSAAHSPEGSNVKGSHLTKRKRTDAPDGQASSANDVRQRIRRQLADTSAAFGTQTLEPNGSQASMVAAPASVSAASATPPGAMSFAYLSRPAAPATSSSAGSRGPIAPANSSIAGSAEKRRRIPGPAGKLSSSEANGVDQKAAPISKGKVKIVHVVDEDEDFRKGPWLAMLSDCEIAMDPRGNPKSVLQDPRGNGSRYFQHNIQWIMREGFTTKIPFLLVLVKTLSFGEYDAFCTFKDPFGQIEGTIHRRVIDQHGPAIAAGTVFLLKNVSVFSPSPSAHYLNVTPDNIQRLWGPTTPAPTPSLTPPVTSQSQQSFISSPVQSSQGAAQPSAQSAAQYANFPQSPAPNAPLRPLHSPPVGSPAPQALLPQQYRPAPQSSAVPNAAAGVAVLTPMRPARATTPPVAPNLASPPPALPISHHQSNTQPPSVQQALSMQHVPTGSYVQAAQTQSAHMQFLATQMSMAVSSQAGSFPQREVAPIVSAAPSASTNGGLLSDSDDIDSLFAGMSDAELMGKQQ